METFLEVLDKLEQLAIYIIVGAYAVLSLVSRLWPTPDSVEKMNKFEKTLDQVVPGGLTKGFNKKEQ